MQDAATGKTRLHLSSRKVMCGLLVTHNGPGPIRKFVLTDAKSNKYFDAEAKLIKYVTSGSSNSASLKAEIYLM